MNRRQFIKTSAIGAAAIAIAPPALKAAAKDDIAQDLKHIAPNSLEPEFVISETGELVKNPQQRLAFSRCFGCYDTCGVRVRIDNSTEQVVRVAGNPYTPANQAGAPMAMDVPPQEAMKRLTALEEQGLHNRATVCGRGNGVLDAMNDPHRVTNCMKRVGKRGENKWQSISYEQLLKEVCEGGDLFGEGPVEGLKALHDHKTSANKKYPDFGPKANQLFIGVNSEQQARWGFMMRFAHSIWGTPNIGCKDAYCGHQQVAGVGLGCFDGTSEGALPTIDYDHCKFAMFIGTSPGSSGNSLNAVGRRMADARSTRSDFKYVVVDPILRSVNAESAKNNGEWVPIKSGGDTALLFGMMQYIINNKRYNKAYLSQPSQAAADTIKEANFTNATYLVVMDEAHPLYKNFLTAETCGLGDTEAKMVMDKATFMPVSSASDKSAALFYDGKVQLKDGSSVHVKTAFTLLSERVNEQEMSVYADYAGISGKKIEALAKEFSAHGRQVGIETNTGCNATDGSLFGFAANMLSTLMAAHNAKGGLFHMNGVGYASMYGIQEEPCYNLMGFEHAEVTGFPAERSGNYEESHEYQDKVKRGVYPYPADQAWTTTYTQENSGEALIAHANGNPFQFKAWINWSTNPLYNCSGLKDQVLDSITDPKQLGLIIAVDPFINETNMYADYFVPDGVQYEEWESARMWGSEYIGDVVSMPVVAPKTEKNAEGKHVCMEQLLIDISKSLGLKGLGKDAAKDASGNTIDIDAPKDYYLRLFANIAHSGSVLPSPTPEDITFTSVDRYMPLLKEKLKTDEIGPTAYMLTRGGRYEAVEQRYEGDFLTSAFRMDVQFQIYNEGLSNVKDSFTGQRYDGLPVFDVDRFWDGTPIRDHWPKSTYPFQFSTFKSQLRSPYSVVLPRIVSLSPTNYIHMNEADALDLDLKTGDTAKVLSPKGAHIEGIIMADKTVSRGSVVVPTGYGHSAFGSVDVQLDGNVRPAMKERGTGIAVNPFNVVDPTRKGASLYRDKLFGCTARHGVPVAVEKV